MDRIRDAWRGRDDFFLLRVVGGSTAAVLAVVSVAVDGVSGDFLLLAGLAVVVFAFPWHRLSALKAGPFEFSLEQGQVRGAIDSIEFSSGVDKERIDGVLARLAPDIERARGGRILWVDDEPTRIVAERRLFRALGVETVVVVTCRDAAQTLVRDNDFDLVITSLVKDDEYKAMQRENRRNPAVVFVQWLRGMDDASIRELVGRDPPRPDKDIAIRDLEVVIYAALPLARIRKMTQPLAPLEPAIETANSLDVLLKKVIRLLADQRSNPIEVPLRKVSSG